MAQIRPLNLANFSGINNVVAEHELAIDSDQVGCELVDAVNVDITNRGRIRRRKGLTKLLNTSDQAHSLWATKDEKRAFYVAGTSLYELLYAENTGTWSSTLLATGLTVSLPVVFLEAKNGVIYFSNGVQRGRITTSGYVADWAPAASSPPVALAAAPGSLPAGRYQVALTLLDAQGVEGGTSGSVSIDLASTGGISVSLPTPPSGASYYVVYCTPTNGDVFYACGVVPTAAWSTPFLIGSMPEGGQLETFGMDQLPPGSLLAEHEGRMYSASSNLLWYSEPYRYGLARVGRNYVPLDAPITVLASVGASLWVCTTTSTYQLLAGGSPESILQNPLPYGAIAGTAFYVPTLDAVGWFSPRGVCIATADGSVKNQTDGRIILQPYEGGRAFVREEDGLRQFIGAMRPVSTTNTLAVRDFAEAELRRKGE